MRGRVRASERCVAGVAWRAASRTHTAECPFPSANTFPPSHTLPRHLHTPPIFSRIDVHEGARACALVASEYLTSFPLSPSQLLAALFPAQQKKHTRRSHTLTRPPAAPSPAHALAPSVLAWVGAACAAGRCAVCVCRFARARRENESSVWREKLASVQFGHLRDSWRANLQRCCTNDRSLHLRIRWAVSLAVFRGVLNEVCQHVFVCVLEGAPCVSGK